MELEITKEQGEEIQRITHRQQRAQRRYFAAILRAVPELAKYQGYHGEIKFRWIGEVRDFTHNGG